MMSLPRGTYLDTSAVDAVIADPRAFGHGAFVVSEYTLGEKTHLPWDEFCRAVDGLHKLGVLFLRVPPLTQIITGNLSHRWTEQHEFVPIDVEEIRAGRAVASRKLDVLRDLLADQFRRRYAELRPHFAEWIRKVEGNNEDRLMDPRPPRNRREFVEAAALEALGRQSAPGPQDPLPDRLRWTFKVWELAMTVIRLDRQVDREHDLRNDPIDAVHYTLGATFCDEVATCDRGIKRIRELVPSPCALLWVTTDSSGIRVEQVDGDNIQARSGP